MKNSDENSDENSFQKSKNELMGGFNKEKKTKTKTDNKTLKC